MADATITLSTTSYTYNGSARKPSVTVVYGEVELTKDTDYTVTYADNTNAGTATVTITAVADSELYTGEATQNFTINPKKISAATITLSTTSYTYSGSARKPTPTVTWSDTTLVKNTDYTVSYKNNTKVGTATVTITGTGNFTGTTSKTFKINPKKTTGLTLSVYRGGFKAAWTKVSTQATGYQLQYSTSKDFSSKTTKTITSYKTVSKSIDGLKANTKYYVRIRTYKTVDDTKYYSGWSSVKSIKTGKLVTTASGYKKYKYSDGTYAKSTFVSIESKKYYFGSDKIMTTGWAKISGSYYYFNRTSGVMQKDTTVDGIKLKSSGKASASTDEKTRIKTMIKARAIYLEVTNPTDSKSTKLKKCFKWTMSCTYKRYRVLSAGKSSYPDTWTCVFANDCFDTKKGCCISEACAFAFLANECGYTAYVCDDTGHGWCEINGLVYDTLFAEAKSFKKYYGRSYSVAGLHRVNKTSLY